MERPMGGILLKLPDDLARESGRCARARGLSRAEYIRQAIEHMNQETQRELRARRLAEASRKVRDESMRVNAEFDAVESDPATE
jgi:hypothetical protein